ARAEDGHQGREEGLRGGGDGPGARHLRGDRSDLRRLPAGGPVLQGWRGDPLGGDALEEPHHSLHPVPTYVRAQAELRVGSTTRTLVRNRWQRRAQCVKLALEGGGNRAISR